MFPNALHRLHAKIHTTSALARSRARNVDQILTDDLRHHCPERTQITGGHRAHRPQDKPSLNRREYGLGHRGLDESDRLPVVNQHLAKSQRGPQTTVMAMITRSGRWAL